MSFTRTPLRPENVSFSIQKLFSGWNGAHVKLIIGLYVKKRTFRRIDNRIFCKTNGLKKLGDRHFTLKVREIASPEPQKSATGDAKKKHAMSCRKSDVV